jgi:hypothetical protein
VVRWETSSNVRWRTAARSSTTLAEWVTVIG